MKTLMEECVLLLPVPDEFKRICDEVDVTVEDALQELVSALSVYAHLAPKDDSRAAAAMVLFQQWLQQRDGEEERLRPLHQLYVQEMLCLAQSPLSRVQRTEAGRELMEIWYRAACRFVGWGGPRTAEGLQCIRLHLTPDVRMLQCFFHVELDDFLLFYMQNISAPPSKGVAEDNRQLALHFFCQDSPPD